jgi:YD repeat-containing protein
MVNKANYLLGTAVSALAASSAAQASDTTSYTYDALGRLVVVTTSGGPNNGLVVGICYDRSGNRTTYSVSTNGSPPPPCPPPPPSPSAQHTARSGADV